MNEVVKDVVRLPVTPSVRKYAIKLLGVPGRDYRAEKAWTALETVWPRDYPKGDAFRGGPAQRKVNEVAVNGHAIVKSHIMGLDIAETMASRLESFKLPTSIVEL